MEVKNRMDVYRELFETISFNHNEKILKFSDFDEEYNSFYDFASVYDSSHSSFFLVTGKDALDFLHRISTNDLIRMEDYSVTDTLFLNEKGRIIDRLKLLKFPENLIMIGSPDNSEKIYRWVERYAVMDDIKLTKMNGLYLYLKLLGKKNEILFTLLFGDQLKNLEENKIYKYVSDNFQCWIFKTEVLPNHFGYEILCGAEFSENLIRYIVENIKLLDYQMIGSDAFEIIRIEQGLPLFPNELNDNFNPYDVNLIKFVSFTKGCYIGQEVIARLDTYEKVKFNFSGFRLERDYDFEDKMIYTKDGNVVGQITSKCYSPRIKAFVCLGVYSKKLSMNDCENLFVKSQEENIKIEIHKLPMIEV